MYFPILGNIELAINADKATIEVYMFTLNAR